MIELSPFGGFGIGADLPPPAGPLAASGAGSQPEPRWFDPASLGEVAICADANGEVRGLSVDQHAGRVLDALRAALVPPGSR